MIYLDAAKSEASLGICKLIDKLSLDTSASYL